VGFRKKFDTAFKIMKENGLTGVLHTIHQKIVALTCTNENEIIFEVFHDASTTGVMCDVGAHHGYCLMPFAKAGWQVFAFEPDPDNRAKLLENTRMYPGVHVDPRAVSDKVEVSVPFFTSDESSGVSSLSAFLPSHELTMMVSTTTLSRFLDEQGLSRVDYLKIDAEGFDLMVLQGVEWEQTQPRVILCEFEDAKHKNWDTRMKLWRITWSAEVIMCSFQNGAQSLDMASSIPGEATTPTRISCMTKKPGAT